MTRPFERPSSVGRPKADCDIAFERDLIEGDLELLLFRTAEEPHMLRRMKDSHWSVAQGLASGMKPVEVSRITGFSATTIANLERDPTFQEALAYCREEQHLENVDMRERLRTLLFDVAQEIQDRIVDTPEAFSVSELRQTAAMLADRTGNGPSSTVHAEVDIISRLSYDEQLRIARALEEVSKISSDVIDITPQEVGA